jgi:hypothetical protein
LSLENVDPSFRGHVLLGPILCRERPEYLANWLLCAIINAVDKRQLTFSSDPIGSDGTMR